MESLETKPESENPSENAHECVEVSDEKAAAARLKTTWGYGQGAHHAPSNLAGRINQNTRHNAKWQNRFWIGAMAFLGRIPGVEAVRVDDDFSNNIFSDLAPILTLFGEQVSKQFMAGSMTWEDNIIFATAPLGIITAMVGAIRIGGPPWLRAIIGRARENKASAEVELTTSTSKDVCELWNGASIVRMMGSGKIFQLVCTEEKMEHPYYGLFTLEEGGRFTTKPIARMKPTSDNESEEEGLMATGGSSSDDEVRRKDYAPNISLNLRSFTAWDRRELRIAAAFGVLVQTCVLIFTAFATYHPRMGYEKEGFPVERYAYPLAAGGTILVAIGMWICSSIVESSTVEKEWRFKKENWESQAWTSNSWDDEDYEEHRNDDGPYRDAKLRVFWLQQGGGVNDQSFDSYVLLGKGPREAVLTSELSMTSNPDSAGRPVNHSAQCATSAPGDSLTDLKASKFTKTMVLLGTFITLSGFVIQFTGLRGLHWSGTIAQLVGTLIMLVVRAYIRRDLVLAPSAFKTHHNYELDWLATRIGRDPTQLWMESQKPRAKWLTQEKEAHARSECPSSCSCELETSDCYRWAVVSGLEMDKSELISRPNTVDEKDTIDDNGNATPQFEYSVSHKIMKIRERLGRLSGWAGPYTATAISVARSIETVMNTLFHNLPEIELYWSIHAKAYPEKSEAQHPVPNTEKIFFRVSRTSTTGNWSASATELESVLSLWLYSAHEKELQDQLSLEKEAIQNSGSDGDWIRFGHGAALNRMCVRKLGPMGGQMVQLLRKWYFGGRTSTIRRILREKSGERWNRLDDAVWHCGCGSETRKPVKETVERHRVVGFSKTLDLVDGGDALSGSGPSTFRTVPYDSFDGVVLCSSCGFIDSEDTELGAFAAGSLELLFAQDMFASFMWAASNRYNGLIKGETIVKATDSNPSIPERWHNFTLQNSVLSTLINDIAKVSNAALGGVDDLFNLVLTPLCYHRKLPIPIEIADYAQRMAEVGEGKGSLTEAGDVYRSLFGACEAFGEKHPTFHKAACLLYEYSETLVDKRRLHEVEDVTFPKGELVGSRKVSELIARKAFELKEVDDETRRCSGRFNQHIEDSLFQQIADVYEVQGRSWPSLAKRGDCTKDHGRSQSIDRMVQKSNHEVQWYHKPVVELVRDIFQTPDKSEHILQRFSELLRSYLDSEPVFNINNPDLTGWTALHYIAAFANSAFFDGTRTAQVNQDTMTYVVDNTTEEFILDSIFRFIRTRMIEKVDAEDFSGRTPLHYACSEAVASMLLNAGANLRHKSRNGMTPVHSAAQLGNVYTLGYFLRSGAPVSPVDHSKRTPLHWASLVGRQDIIELLLGCGADLLARDAKGRNPVHYAVLAENPNVSVLRALLRDGSSETGVERDAFKAKDADGNSPLLLATKAGHLKADNEEHRGLIELLSMYDEHPCDLQGLSPIHCSALYGSQDGVEIILKSEWFKRVYLDGINTRDGCGVTPLALAVSAGHDSLVRWFLDRDDIDFRTRNPTTGRTLLSNALQSGSENIFQLLLEKYGVETVIRSNSEEDSSTSLRAPKEVMQDVVLDLLEANDGYGKIDIYGVDDDSPLLWAAKHRKEGVLRLLLDIQWTDSIDVNPRDGDGRTPLSYAAASGEIGIMRALLESKEMEVDVNSKDNSGFTPLHWASQNGETDILELLLRHPKTDVNARNNKGRTALSLAAENGRTKTIKALLKEEDIDIVSKDDSGSTTKDWALKSGDFSIIGLLQTRLDRNKTLQLLLGTGEPSEETNHRDGEDSTKDTEFGTEHREHTEKPGGDEDAVSKKNIPVTRTERLFSSIKTKSKSLLR